jgi:hypothetical protein
MAVGHNRKPGAVWRESPTGPTVEPGNLATPAFLRIKSDKSGGLPDHLVVNTKRFRRPRAKETVDPRILKDQPRHASGDGHAHQANRDRRVIGSGSMGRGMREWPD